MSKWRIIDQKYNNNNDFSTFLFLFSTYVEKLFVNYENFHHKPIEIYNQG